MKYFNTGKIDEFKCRCGNCSLGIGEMDADLLSRLDEAREIADIPFKLNRAISCVAHNAAIGGSNTSSHLKGYAVDIDCNDSVSRYRIVTALLAVGFKRIGVYNSKEKGTFIHADLDPTKPKGVIW